MDHGGHAGVEEQQATENLTTPRLEDLRIEFLESLQVCLECPTGHELGHEHDVLPRRPLGGGGTHNVPVVVEPDDVGVLQPLEQLRLLLEPPPLVLGELLVLQLGPRHADSRLRVQSWKITVLVAAIFAFQKRPGHYSG